MWYLWYGGDFAVNLSVAELMEGDMSRGLRRIVAEVHDVGLHT